MFWNSGLALSCLEIILLQKSVRNLKYDESNGRYTILSKERYTKLLQNIIHLDKGRSLCSDYIWGSELDKR